MDRPQQSRGVATAPGAQRKAPRSVIQRENKLKGPRLEEQQDLSQRPTPVAGRGRFHWLALATGPDGKSTAQEGNTMNERQAYLLEQSHSFQVGFQDQRSGLPLDESISAEWQRGWKWASLNRR